MVFQKVSQTVLNDKTSSIKNQQSSSSASEVLLIKERITKTLQGIPVDTYPPELSKLHVSLAAASSPVISSVTPTSASAGTDTQITITGSGFGTKASRESVADVLFFSSTDDGTHLYHVYASGWFPVPPYFDVLVNGFLLNGDSIDSWSDTQIKVRVPTGINENLYWGGASSGYLVVLADDGNISNFYPFAVTFSVPKTWGSKQAKWNSSPTYYVNPDSQPGLVQAVPECSWNME